METITVTKRAISMCNKTALAILIPKDVVNALKIVKGNLLEVTFKNTGLMASEDLRTKKVKPEESRLAQLNPDNPELEPKKESAPVEEPEEEY